MPVVTRSRSRRGRKPASKSGEDSPKEGEATLSTPGGPPTATPRRSARIAANKSRSKEVDSSEEGQSSMTPASSVASEAGATQTVKNPFHQPPVTGISLGNNLDSPMQFVVPRHEAESPLNIRNFMRNLSDSPVTLQDTQMQQSTDSNTNTNTNTNDAGVTSTTTNMIKSLLSPNRIGQFKLTNQPKHVPSFNTRKQQWSYPPEQEVPETIRNLIIFMFAVIIAVMAWIYRDTLFLFCDQYMPSTISDIPSKINEFAGMVYLFISGMIQSFINMIMSFFINTRKYDNQLFGEDDDTEIRTEDAAPDDVTVEETVTA